MRNRKRGGCYGKNMIYNHFKVSIIIFSISKGLSIPIGYDKTYLEVFQSSLRFHKVVDFY